LRLKLIPLTVIALLTITIQALAQNPHAALSSLPEADTLIYISPQRILNEAVPRLMDPAEVTKMRSTFADLKRSAGFDPSAVEYIVMAVRFNKPATDLSFVAPDVMVVVGGDFSSDSLMTLGQLYLQDKVRVEKYGSKAITLMKIDPVAAEAEKTPLLKPYSELGVVPLTANSLAFGNLRYLKSAIDAAEGNGRISAASLESLLRDPNALISFSGTPLTSFAKSFGMMGLENTSRESRCDTRFGNFYAAVTMNGSNFSLRGAMNADNPDTAKIIQGLLWGLMQQGITAVPDKDAQTMLKALKLTAKDNEIVVEADIPDTLVADFVKSVMAPPVAKVQIASPNPTPKRRVRKKRTH
jgi:hypothetical protein